MENTLFISALYPEMNPFLRRLELALNNLPNDPKPNWCGGFMLAYYDSTRGFMGSDFEFHPQITSIEQIGTIPQEKRDKYRFYAGIKCCGVLYKGVSKSDGFWYYDDCESNQPLQMPRDGVEIKGDATGVSAHHSMVDEAIGILWDTSRKLYREVKTPQPFQHDEFFKHIKITANEVTKSYYEDNTWVDVIANLMINAK